MAENDEKLAKGQVIGRYTIISALGSGGMGDVYLALDTRLDRKVAIKVLPARLVHDPDRLRRFEQEARAASGLNHPNIVTIHEIGSDGETHYIAMEYVEGETLRRRCKNSTIPIDESLQIAVQLAAALDVAHRNGIVHRDVKPENIMIREDGLVKMLDFGLAKLSETNDDIILDSEAPTRALIKTTPGLVMGTVTYMSPEQARGKETDARTDIFSLGVVFYEMLTGRMPFAGGSIAEILGALLHTEPEPLGEVLNEAAPNLWPIVAKTLRKNPDQRYQTAKSLLIDLKRCSTPAGSAAGDETVPPRDQNGIRTGTDREVPVTSSNDRLESVDPETGTRNAPSTVDGVTGLVRQRKSAVGVVLAALLIAAIGFGYWLTRSGPGPQIQSIAVLPFINASGSSDVEYLSDGMTESLINNLSQLPNLSVKARSSVFHYKEREVEPQRIAAELNVQAFVQGRVIQRGDELTLYLSLVDARSGDQLWGEQYDRKMTDLVALQREIAREVSQKLRSRISGVDEQKLARNYTENAEAYQLYLKGRYHILKLSPAESHKGIAYFQEAIAIDPSYALAYRGLSHAYSTLGLAGEMPSTDWFPKAKAASQKSIEIDDQMADGHMSLGLVHLWYDWDWSAAERELKKALELNPNSPDAQWAYAHLLSNTGRHEESLAWVKRAREQDPLNLFIGSIEAQFLTHAGKEDEALVRLKEVFNLNPNFWFAHMQASSSYIQKGMYEEAVAEARRAKELSAIQTVSDAFGGYALAKWGKKEEARVVLEQLLNASNERYIPPYHIAMIYNGLDERDAAFAWLDKGIKQRDPKMAFLKVEPKWNNLHSDARFQDLLQRVGFRP